MKKKSVLPQNILALAVFTTLTTFCWIGLSVYLAFKKTSLTPIIQSQMEPLNPEFDQNTLETLKKRKSYSQAELDSVPEITKFTLPTPAATESTEINNE